MKFTVTLFIALFFLTSCLPNKKTTANFEKLATMMEGNFSSQKQSKNNSHYKSILLRMTPIWKDKGTYFVVEQTLFDNQDKPFSIQIHKLYQRRYDIIREVYTIKNEQEWLEKRKDSQNYSHFSEADLELQAGCEILIRQSADGSYSGHTGHDCHLTEFAATYSSAGIVVTDNQIRLWEQGYDKDWNLLWGNVKGGYVLDKM